MYTVIGSPNTRALRVYWALEELQLDYEFGREKKIEFRIGGPWFLPQFENYALKVL